MVEVVEQVTEKQRLALLAEPEHRVQLGAGARRCHPSQELDVPGRHLHVDHEVRAREREQHVDLLVLQHDRVEHESALAVMEHGHEERQLVMTVDDLPEHVGGLVAVEGRAEHLDLVVGLEMLPHLCRTPVEGREEMVEILSEVAERPAPPEIEEDALEAIAQAAGARVVAAVDRRVGIDVLGRDRRAHEDKIVVRIRPPEDSRDHGVEERLGELGLGVVDEQADVEELGLLPDGSVERRDVEPCPEALDALDDARIVETDPLLHGLLGVTPRGCIEALLCLGARRAEEPVVPVEALDQNGDDGASGGAAVIACQYRHVAGCGRHDRLLPATRLRCAT